MNWKLHFVLSVNLSISNMNLDLPEMLEHFWKILLLSNVDVGDHGKGGDVTMIHPEGRSNITSTMSNRICHIASMGRS